MSEIIRPNDMMYGPRTVASQPSPEVGVIKKEALKVLDEDSLSLGDLNPLIHRLDLLNSESVDAIKLITHKKIAEARGITPKFLESSVVYDAGMEKADLRFIARFEVDKLNKKQMGLLEDLVKKTYGLTVRTRKDSKGNDIAPEIYPPTQRGEESKSKTGGWYMGPDMNPTSSLHVGLFVFKDLGKVDKDNFLTDVHESSKYIVEVREVSQYQTDLVAFITQVSSVLGQKKLLDSGELLYNTYYDLMRLGLKKVNRDVVYGMDDALDRIKRSLVSPLANPDLSRGVQQEAQSVLMVGVPGTGKTLAVEELLQEETGVFILPIDPYELQKELRQNKEKQTLLPRISNISRMTGKRVILHVDDIENMVEGDDETHSTLLNLMAGVRESGFNIIAATNKPEKIDPALLQPQRFGTLIHCGLQNKLARFEMLKIHATANSTRVGFPLFTSDEARNVILHEVADKTDYFTPRYTADVATRAKYWLTERVSKGRNKNISLTEADLEGYNFTVEDWEKALIEVSSAYDSEAVRKRDEELKEFVQKHMKTTVGFSVGPIHPKKFSPEVFKKVAEIEMKLKPNQTQTIKNANN